MAGENQEEGSKTSVQDIAAMLLKKPSAETERPDDTDQDDQDDQSPTQGSEEDDLETDANDADDQSPTQGTQEGDEQSEQDQTEPDDASTEDEAEDGEADETTEDGQPQILDVTDDDLIDVMIDGKLEQRTLGELKKAIAGEGAIEKRLQEATEARKTAHAERTSILEALADQERVVVTALQALDDTVFKPVIPAPDPKLKDKNPALYLRHKEAYDEDQKRIAEGKKAAQDKVADLLKQRQQRLKEYGEAAAPVIAKLIPELADPKKAPAKLNELVATAKSYGYTEVEISNALDPRMFHLVRDALAYRKLLDRSKEVKVTDLSNQGKKVPRKLRSGNTRAASLVATKAKQQEQVRKTAAQTGKVKDVAAAILQPKVK